MAKTIVGPIPSYHDRFWRACTPKGYNEGVPSVGWQVATGTANDEKFAFAACSLGCQEFSAAAVAAATAAADDAEAVVAANAAAIAKDVEAAAAAAIVNKEKQEAEAKA